MPRAPGRAAGRGSLLLRWVRCAGERHVVGRPGGGARP